MNTDELLTPRELADFLKIPLSGVYRLSHLKALPVIRLSHRAIRFSRAETQKWLDAKTQSPLEAEKK